MWRNDGRLVAGWLVGGWLVDGRLVAGWWLAGWLVAGWWLATSVACHRLRRLNQTNEKNTDSMKMQLNTFPF
jgi:hypothetical protein